MKNIKFEYEYRDAAGYRKGGEMIFSNPSGITELTEVTSAIREALFDQEFFYPYKLNVPKIHFDDWSPKLDHDWYRFEELAFTDEAPTDDRTFDEFLSDMKCFAKEPVL